MLVMQWGQFLGLFVYNFEFVYIIYYLVHLVTICLLFTDHDVTSTPQTRGFNNSLLKCCGHGGQFLENDLLHPDCMPIQVSDRDLFYSQFNATCMEFVRSSPAPRRDCTLGW